MDEADRQALIGAAAAALDWWREAGVDTLAGDAPVNWLALPEPARRPAEPAPGPRAGAVPGTGARTGAGTAGAPVALDPVLQARIAAADSAEALAALWREAAGPGARLFEGDPAASLLFVLDAPLTPAGEALAGGDAGRLLCAMFRSIGRAPDTVCLAALAPPGGLASLGPGMGRMFLSRLTAVSGCFRALVALGGPATTAITGVGQGVARLRGQWREEAGLPPVMPTFHPAFLMAHPAQKALAWADLLRVKTRLAL